MLDGLVVDGHDFSGDGFHISPLLVFSNSSLGWDHLSVLSDLEVLDLPLIGNIFKSGATYFKWLPYRRGEQKPLPGPRWCSALEQCRCSPLGRLGSSPRSELWSPQWKQQPEPRQRQSQQLEPLGCSQNRETLACRSCGGRASCRNTC
jgi:hypothetical protein